MNEGQVLQQRQLLIAGDSHVKAFGIPLKSADGSVELVRVNETVCGVASAWPRDFNEYWDAVATFAQDRCVAVSWGGNRHLAHYLFAPSPLFDFLIAEQPDLPLDESALIVPEEAIRAFIVSPIRNMERRVASLRNVAAQVLVPGTPPPKDDDAFIRNRFSKEPHFVRMAENLGVSLDEVPFSPALLRLKMWIVMQSLLREMAERTGSIFIPVPSPALTEKGFLHPDCYADDVTHANENFGKIMLKELLATCEWSN